jgi:hypothetical protein
MREFEPLLAINKSVFVSVAVETIGGKSRGVDGKAGADTSGTLLLALRATRIDE